ncbi:MAG: penicillin-binding transpeptidase domain-containing protein [Byssovorax sp.]
MGLAAMVLGACASPGAAPTGAPVVAPSLFGSTIDPILQPFAEGEIKRAVETWEAKAGVVLVLDPVTGAVLVDAGIRGGSKAPVALQTAYVTGSTLKTITLAIALDERVVAMGDKIDGEMGARTYPNGLVLRDAGKHGVMTVGEALFVSSNIGFSKIFDKLGGEKLAKGLKRFHFGEAPPLPGATAGDMPAPLPDGSFEGGVVAAGEGLKATPLQLALAYMAIANEGGYVKPTLAPGSKKAEREAILRPETARALLGVMERVVSEKDGTGRYARLPGVRVAGKTGTGEWDTKEGKGTYVSFVGIVPADKPRFVILVGVESPKEGATGGEVAAPVFAKIAQKALGG